MHSIALLSMTWAPNLCGICFPTKKCVCHLPKDWVPPNLLVYQADHLPENSWTKPVAALKFCIERSASSLCRNSSSVMSWAMSIPRVGPVSCDAHCKAKTRQVKPASHIVVIAVSHVRNKNRWLVAVQRCTMASQQDWPIVVIRMVQLYNPHVPPWHILPDSLGALPADACPRAS